jgi:hypothetical protein
MINKNELKYKEFIRLENRLNKLYQKLQELPNVKLAQPYQRGWIIRYDLREDIKKRADYPLIKEVLDKVYMDSYTNNVNIVKAIRRGDESVRVKTRWGNLNSISEYYPRKVGFSDKEYQVSRTLNKYYDKYFQLDVFSDGYRKFGYKKYYVCFPNYWLVLKVRPNIITHKKLKGGEIEKEHDFIRDRLYYSGEFNSFITNYGSSYPASKDRAKTRDNINKFINGELEDIYNEKVPMEYHH